VLVEEIATDAGCGTVVSRARAGLSSLWHFVVIVGLLGKTNVKGLVKRRITWCLLWLF
jgi:hypothetical protein